MYRISEELRELALDLVKENNLNWVDIEQIEFVSSIKKNKKFADIRTIRYPASLYTNKQYLITTYASFDELNDKKKRIVLLHELLHIGENRKLQKHDIEEFAVIIKKYGFWREDKNVTNS